MWIGDLFWQKKAVAGFGAVRAEIGIRKDTGSTQTRERGDCDRYFVGVEMPPGKESSDVQDQDKVQKRERGRISRL